jgi:hypothetical protein
MGPRSGRRIGRFETKTLDTTIFNRSGTGKFRKGRSGSCTEPRLQLQMALEALLFAPAGITGGPAVPGFFFRILDFFAVGTFGLWESREIHNSRYLRGFHAIFK